MATLSRWYSFTLVSWIVTSASLVGCGSSDKAPPAKLSEQVLAANPVKESAALPVKDESPLRRSFTRQEMKFADCMSVAEDGRVLGKGCTSGCVMFGPYLSAPANSDVRISFDVESEGAMILGSDIVSGKGGLVFYGALEDQGFEPRKRRRMAFRVHVFNPADAIETRLWLRSDAPVNFSISNFSLEVR